MSCEPELAALSRETFHTNFATVLSVIVLLMLSGSLSPPLTVASSRILQRSLRAIVTEQAVKYKDLAPPAEAGGVYYHQMRAFIVESKDWSRVDWLELCFPG
jgi:hypothetical protein